MRRLRVEMRRVVSYSRRAVAQSRACVGDGVLCGALGARGDGVVAAPDVAVRTSLESNQ